MEFKLPDIGEGVHEGEITKWLVKPGQSISADQPMVEVMTDKATVEIPSPVTGTVGDLMAKEGQTIEVGKVLLTINENGKGAAKETAPPKPPPSKSPEPKEPPSAPKAAAPSQAPQSDVIPFNVLATPATRKLARDLNVDVKGLQGTGPSGRITKVDVQMAYEGHQAATPRSSHPQSSSTAVTSTPVNRKMPVVQRGALERIPLKGIRKKIAEGMTHSLHTAAHFTYVEEVDFTEIVRLRSAALEEARKKELKLTFLPFIIKAVIPALKEFPYLNSSLDDERQEIILKGDYNIGIATDTANGLIVPVIKNADQKTIWELAEEITGLSEKARAGKLAIDDLKGGTFTLTNAGSIGGVFATPIINYPEVAILGVNAIRKRPMVVEDQIVIRDMMFLSLSVDHRVVDGADAARFMNRLVYFLSDPKRLVFA
jgi:pyruvate dehydrogenase E2 component (dihydrolipoamide acetyltransferase)